MYLVFLCTYDIPITCAAVVNNIILNCSCPTRRAETNFSYVIARRNFQCPSKQNSYKHAHAYNNTDVCDTCFISMYTKHGQNRKRSKYAEKYEKQNKKIVKAFFL